MYHAILPRYGNPVPWKNSKMQWLHGGPSHHHNCVQELKFLIDSFFLFLFYFLNYESVVIHLHETWKIQNQVTYSFTMKEKVKVAQSCLTLWDPHGIYSPWNSPGQNTGVGNLSLLQGIFPNQGSNPGLLHCRQILYQLSHKGSPRILEWVAYPFSSGSSQPRNRTGVSCIASGFFTNYAIREASLYITIIF